MIGVMVTDKHVRHLVRGDTLFHKGIHNQRSICHHPWVRYNERVLTAYEYDSARDIACPIRRDAGNQLPPFDGFDVPFDENRHGIHAILLSYSALQRTLHPIPSAKYARS